MRPTLIVCISNIFYPSSEKAVCPLEKKAMGLVSEGYQESFSAWVHQKFAPFHSLFSPNYRFLSISPDFPAIFIFFMIFRRPSLLQVPQTDSHALKLQRSAELLSRPVILMFCANLMYFVLCIDHSSQNNPLFFCGLIKNYRMSL